MEANTINTSVSFKQSAVIEFLIVEGILQIEIHRQMEKIYGTEGLDISNVRRCAKKCNEGKVGVLDLSDKHRSGRPLSAIDDSHKEAVDAMIQDNRRITQREILEELGIPQEQVGCIIADLDYRKVYAK